MLHASLRASTAEDAGVRSATLQIAMLARAASGATVPHASEERFNT